MKKLSFILGLMCSTLWGYAQNVQLHYDFGRNIYNNEEATRQKVTVTFEQFKADDMGSWYWFIDLDMYHDGMKGAYTEIARDFKVLSTSSNTLLTIRTEYDGGMNTFKAGGGMRFQNAALVGPNWSGHNEDFTITWSVAAMYKQFFKYGSADAYASAQITATWGTTFADKKLTCSGFIDFWRGEKANHHGQLVMLTEPQLWYNVNSRLSAGAEVEISNNFIFPECNTDKSFYLNPTVAVKYNF